MKRIVLRSILIILSVLVVFKSYAIAEVIVIRMSHDVPVAHNGHTVAMKFAELVKEKSKGNLEVKIYPTGQLYKSKEAVEAVKRGDIEMTYIHMSHIARLEKALQIASVPFAGNINPDLYSVIWDKLRSRLLDPLETKGIKVLGAHFTGYVCYSTGKKPIIKPSDMKGLKIRVVGKADGAFVEAAGGIPTFIPSPEAFMALQQGIVDGNYTGTASMIERKIWEVQKYMVSFQNGGSDPFGFVVNLKFYNGLSPDMRKILDESSKETSKFGGDLYLKDDAKYLKMLKEKLIVHIPTKEEIKEWDMISDMAIQKLESELGKDIIKDFVELKNKYRVF
ncbi:MAG TPA: TRAP transporter substrate-binding protein [Syntrophales bacterium]|nr:TRAP transporter substrate-binding protein [Syntrophales bacterium]